ncbi:MAG TPA: glycosyltransferase [Chthoniobacterales bacterium]|nr:glycosyltransferase [Chthoniobacterales bacterium]
MRLNELDRFASDDVDLAGKRLLIFIVAYNAEATIEKVLRRIPHSLRTNHTEVLIIDDSSSDETFARGVGYQRENAAFKITVLRTPENQGYGGNQKLGYRYAIDNGFDIVALLHGDGKYAPEKLPALLKPVIANETDAVLGSRLVDPRAALHAGMPFGKWIGNRTFTAFENTMLGTKLSDFHCGYRIYSTRALAEIPFEKNTNDFHFDTEIVIQFLLKKKRILEAPIPMFYGSGISYRDAMKYAWNIFKTTVRARLCQLSLFYDRRYDFEAVEEVYDLKLGYASSHTAAIAAAKPGCRILDIGCGQGRVGAEFAKLGCHVTGLDRYIPNDGGQRKNMDFVRWDLDRAEFPISVSKFDQIFMLDIIEHLKDPSHFLDELRFATGCKRPEIVLTTANIGFFATRFMLTLGQLNYGKKGILDVTHTRLFTVRSIRELLTQSGYKILELRGIPAPFPLALGRTFLARILLALNKGLIRLSKGLFAYQIFIRAEARPTVNNLLKETISTSGTKADALTEAA